ncbi:MAG TPA: cytochrome c3 family protein [Candidatus Binatia bacterium]|jgi:hypothetical protein|nr:cytochrome c3 family protein [Candidatus Binatia bacterium]
MQLNKPLNTPLKIMPACLLAVVLLLCGAAQLSAATALNARIALRPVTPSDKGDYALASTTEVSGGLSTIGVGTPAYLEAQVSLAIPASDIVSVTWALTSRPLGSLAVLTNNPLGATVPVYAPADRLVYQVAGTRSLLRPDLEGQYTVTATITTASYGTTNVTQTITAGSYLGWSQGCIACHSGGLIAPNMTMWTNTLHASKFSRSIDGLVGSYSMNCVSCHTLGYDTYPLAANGGFDDVMAQTGWTFPTVLTNGNWASMQTNYPALCNVANIQCENCHGPGSKHIIYNGKVGNTNCIAVSWDAGNCGQCHDAKSHHIKVPEWNNSKHAITVTDPSGPGREACVACHTGMGFAERGASTTNTAYMPITCVGCHDPHDASNPHQLRNVGPVTLADGTVVANKGTSELCMNCHHARTSATNSVATFTGGRFGPHHGPQTDMFMGVNGFDYGQNIPSSAHRDAITNGCVTCHMQPTPASTDPAFLLTGGHTFSVIYTNGTTNIQMTAACVQCHGPTPTFDMVREDYNGDGIIEGVQTEVQHLLDQLSTLLPPDNSVKSSISPAKGWTPSQVKAAWNWSFVMEDRSKGVHNVAYTVGLLKASIADLTPDANHDGLPDAWQIQYFGSVTNVNAAPNACPAGDGIPNWLKYALGLNPTTSGVTVPGGVVWANGTRMGGNNATNTVQIYTAAEVAFNTEVGKTYQLQAISSLGGGWQNVGATITGNGNAMSYVTPTRPNVQQYFRVVHTP